jgi:PII-like signaling protein
MKGYQVTFFTQQDKRQHGHPLAEWLMLAARKMGFHGATIVAASEGFGHHGRIHSAHFFDLADQPLEVTVAGSAEEVDRLFEYLRGEGVHVFYVKSEVEYGFVGEPQA